MSCASCGNDVVGDESNGSAADLEAKACCLEAALATAWYEIGEHCEDRPI
jgi:hypothetical protein